MILFFLIFGGYRPLPPELQWAPIIEIAHDDHQHVCIELDGAGALLFCPDMKALELRP